MVAIEREHVQLEALKQHWRDLIANIRKAHEGFGTDDPDFDKFKKFRHKNKDIPWLPFGGEMPIDTGDAPGTNTGSTYAGGPEF